MPSLQYFSIVILQKFQMYFINFSLNWTSIPTPCHSLAMPCKSVLVSVSYSPKFTHYSLSAPTLHKDAEL